ncbi:MAG: ABC transporter substrate-binding protein [Armatimonadota bacterium]|nr:ABC transporter substrate-binding protein [Armatimonadota bacterium]MDR7486755.1 ABC transporter substrate-binding protein [Armatimonadota bacterium]MDR7533228.1 ABC transporter substrate-binding protein [Armatimonadota bacterium]MDR7535384.1 ABC transporter substrate-binding protein [Armatimonadota bacterium]
MRDRQPRPAMQLRGPHGVRRRRGAKTVSLLIGLLAAAALAAHAGTAPPARYGGTLVVRAATDPGTLNGGITTAAAAHTVADSIFNGLVQLDEQLNPTPDLAERWTVSPDGRAYTFTLVRGVRWHDGRPLTSADVKFTYEQVLLKYHARTRAGLEGVLAAVETPDPGTVVFRFHRPFGALVQRADVTEAPILPRHLYEGTDILQNPSNAAPVGTGPFRFKEWTRGAQVTLVKNERYFKPGLPVVDQLTFRVLPQPALAVIALERGEVDYLDAVPAPDVERLRTNRNLTMRPTLAGPGGSFCIGTLIPNLTRPPLDNLKVRQAMYHAINRDFIVLAVLGGQGRVATAPISRGIRWAQHPGLPQVRYDVARANALLDDAGFARGAGGVRFALTYPAATTQIRYAEVVRDNLRDVGIDVNVVPMEFTAATQRVFVRRDFDLAFASYCNGPDPDIGVKRMYVSSNIQPIPFSNGASYRNAAIDQLFDLAAGSLDLQERGRHYRAIQEILVRDLPYLWLVETFRYVGFHSGLRAVQYWTGNVAERAYWAAPR